MVHISDQGQTGHLEHQNFSWWAAGQWGPWGYTNMHITNDRNHNIRLFSTQMDEGIDRAGTADVSASPSLLFSLVYSIVYLETRTLSRPGNTHKSMPMNNCLFLQIYSSFKKKLMLQAADTQTVNKAVGVYCSEYQSCYTFSLFHSSHVNTEIFSKEPSEQITLEQPFTNKQTNIITNNYPWMKRGRKEVTEIKKKSIRGRCCEMAQRVAVQQALTTLALPD